MRRTLLLLLILSIAVSVAIVTYAVFSSSTDVPSSTVSGKVFDVSSPSASTVTDAHSIEHATPWLFWLGNSAAPTSDSALVLDIDLTHAAPIGVEVALFDQSSTQLAAASFLGQAAQLIVWDYVLEGQVDQQLLSLQFTYNGQPLDPSNTPFDLGSTFFSVTAQLQSDWVTQNAYLRYATASWNINYEGGTPSGGLIVSNATVTGTGEYVVGLDFTQTPAGYASGLAIAALDIEDGETSFPLHYIEITSIRVNGSEIAFGKGYTCSENGVTTRMNIYNTWVNQLPPDARSYDGIIADASPIIVDPADFSAVQTVVVAFTLHDEMTGEPPIEFPDPLQGSSTTIGAGWGNITYTVAATLPNRNQSFPREVTLFIPDGAVPAVWYNCTLISYEGNEAVIRVESFQTGFGLYMYYDGPVYNYNAVVTSMTRIN